ncbi:MAG: FtsH protease activity modulator HflK [Acidobacteriota bacterium]|nr:FtsH protease activity modulator HflK [Acidobacteriota bacterium]
MAFDNKGFGNGPQIELPDLSNLRKNLGGARWVVVAILVLALLATSFYTVQPEEVAVVLRFGKYVREENPGLHFKLPFGIERNIQVPVQRQLKEEFGFRTVSSGVRSDFTSRGHETESSMLTGDLNAAVVEWVVQYRVADAEKFLFRVRNVEETFRDMSEAMMREVVGDRTVNEVITVGRQEIEDLVKTGLQDLCDEYQTGIRVDQVVLQSVTPPDPVKPSFNEVNQAEQEREQLINEAQSQYNQIIPRAEGEARRTVQEAEGYALNRVNRSEGDAALFVSLFQEYRKAPDVTRNRMYLETMSEILPLVGRKLIIDDDVEGLVPLLNMDGAGPLTAAGRDSQ